MTGGTRVVSRRAAYVSKRIIAERIVSENEENKSKNMDEKLKGG